MPARVGLGVAVEEEHRRSLAAHDRVDLRLARPETLLPKPREQDLVG
jgi:hypothetical protein